mgnify:FL=1
MEEIEMQEKIKPILNSAAETMLQSFYARAQYSKSKRKERSSTNIKQKKNILSRKDKPYFSKCSHADKI